jgi:hypothetical protein
MEGKRKQSKTGEVLQRHSTIYDAVAQRITNGGFLASSSHASTRNIDTPNDPHRILRPAEALFKREGGARGESLPASDPRVTMTDEKMEEMYSWTRHLPSELELPEGELLEAIHAYASDFYGAQRDGMDVMGSNMDGTALLALGILLEEVAREQLGEDGDLALLEGENESLGPGKRWFNGVRTVPFHTDHERGFGKAARAKRNKAAGDEFVLVKGSLMGELLADGRRKTTNE